MTTPYQPVPQPTGEPEAQPQITITGTDFVPQPNMNGGEPQYFTAEQLEAARKQEKEKLYGRLSSAEERYKALEAEMNAIRAERDQRAAEEAAQRAEAEAEAKRRAEEEMSARELIEQRESEWNNRFAQLEAERQQERLLLEKERQYSELRAYIGQRAREEADNIAPELIDLIDGSTPDQVEERIAVLRAKSEQIANSVMQAQAAQRTQMRGVTTAGYATTGPLENEAAHRQLTPEEIEKMPMHEYVKIRSQLLGNRQNETNRGLFS